MPCCLHFNSLHECAPTEIVLDLKLQNLVFAFIRCIVLKHFQFTATGVGGAVGLIAHAHVEVKPDQDCETATTLHRNTKGITVTATTTKRNRVTFLHVQVNIPS